MGAYVGRWALVVVLLLVMAGCSGAKSSRTGLLEDRTILMILGWPFNEEEFNTPKRIFESEGAEVVTASGGPGLRVLGMSGMVLLVDKLLNEVKVEEYDAIVFIGGRGAVGYWDDPVAHGIVQKALGSGKVLAAICLGPVTLANAGVLNAVKATVSPGYGDHLKTRGAIYTGAKVEVEGNIVTADGPESAEEFAATIVNLLSARGRRVLIF